MTLETCLLYLAAIAAFFATPPDTSQLLIISNAMQHGLKRAGWTILGDLSANVIQMTAAAFGLAAVIAASAQAFTLVKWLGAAYLAWMGLQLFFGKPQEANRAAGSRASRLKLFRQGFITSSANPYAVIFFAALFPQFIDPAQAIVPQLAILGGTYLVVDGVLLVAWGGLAVRSAARLRNLSSRMVNRICGSLMMAAAALLASRDIAPQSR